ncbi:MAG: TolC family protein [Acidobacteriia bacterium]|nr:TolC family protein [Terriglobia bacterium]
MPEKGKWALLALLAFGAGQTALAQAPPPKLTLKDAEALAIKNHPQVLAAQSEVGFANQQVVETRSAYYPTVDADVTGSTANNGARIGAGFLTDSRLFNRFGQGITVSQLVTDLGRTPSLVASSRFNAQASDQNYQATRYTVLLDVNRAYYDALHAQAVVRVAEETVAARQLLFDQINSLAKNNLKSQLDVSFADVNVSEAKLLLLRAQDSVQEAYAELSRALGSDQVVNYQLVDEPLPPSPPSKADDLIAQAIANRPELASLRYSREAAYKFAEAEKDLGRPTVSLVGVAGYIPYIAQLTSQQIPSEYGGAAVNVQIPVFNGHLFSARREAAHFRALEADQNLRNQQERIARDVRVAWASSMTAFQRIDVTAQFLRQASLALDLAQGRYNLGLSSIVELTQGQLNLTQAEIENLSAKYDYQSQYSVLQYALGLLR